MNEVADIGAVEAVSDEPLFDRSDATCLVERYSEYSGHRNHDF